MEIGTEELPATYLPGLVAQLKTETETLLSAGHLGFGSVESFGTPRRLVVVVRKLAGMQRKPAEEIRGPSKQVSYDKDGRPTPALLSFLRSRGGALEQTKLVETAKGAYVYLIKPPTTTSTAKLLPALLPQVVEDLRSPKTMRWDDSGVRFARPIRWMLAFYGSTSIRLAGKLSSGTTTRIGRPQVLREARVASIPGYFQTLKRAGILLDQAERERRIRRLVEREARRAGGIIAPEMISHGLLEEVTNLVEQPFPLAGSFDSKYLGLPREVLLASMAKHQRVFAIEGQGKILPRFVAVLEGKPGKPNAVQAVIERILNARLADSLLFWLKDLDEPLDKTKLQDVTFHEKLGSMEEKTFRISQLNQRLEEVWQLNAQEIKQLQRACVLAKTDLVKALVREFPTLQGVMGKHYALHAGEEQAVAEAIEEHYLPLGGKLPKTLIGSALAILDKYDTLASYFSIGIEPTGDQDPFGLRRAAQGIVEVAWAIHRPLSFQLLFEKWARAIFVAWQTCGLPAHSLDGLEERLRRYLLERLYTFAWPKPVPSMDIIDAVLDSPCDDLVDAMDRIVSLTKLGKDQALLKAAKVVERTGNILKGADGKRQDVDVANLKEPSEQKLGKLYQEHEGGLRKLIEDKSYVEATKRYGEIFFEPLHEFFDKVMVNVPDEALRQNRLALMRAINVLYTERVADLSKLMILQPRTSQEAAEAMLKKSEKT